MIDIDDEFKLKYDSIEEQLRWDYGYQEFLDDAIDIAVVVSAQYLACYRKHPKLLRWNLAKALCRIWYEMGAIVSHERGKLFLNYVPRVLRKFGREKVRM